MRKHTRPLIIAVSAFTIALTMVAPAGALSSMSSIPLSSSASPSTPAPEQPNIPAPTPPEQPELPGFQLPDYERDYLETMMELDKERFYLRGGGFPRVANDNIAVAVAQDVENYTYLAENEHVAYAEFTYSGASVVVDRWDLETAATVGVDFYEDVVAPDFDGLNYGTHSTSDEDYVYVVTAWTLSPY